MEAQVTNSPAAPATPAGQSAGAGESIRDHMMRRLAQERGEVPSRPAERASAPAATAPTEQASEPSAAEPPEEEAGDEQQAAAASDDDAAEAGDQPDEDPPAIVALREKLLEDDRKRRADYTRKTQRIAETARQLDADGQTLQTHAQFIANLIDLPVRQLQELDWATLQVQDPAAFQTKRKELEARLNMRNGVMQQLAAIEKQNQERAEQHKQQIAAVSREILKTEIEGWSNRRYAEIRDMAINEFGYTREEIDQIVDHRFIRMANVALEAKSAKAKLKGVTRQQQAAKPQAANRPQVRNEAGQFQSAKQHLMSNPGDKGVLQNYFRQKLAAERKRNS